MPFKVIKWNIKTIAQVVYMCSAVIVAYAALEAAKALRSQADAQWLGEAWPQNQAGSQFKTQVFVPKLMEIVDRYGPPLKNKDDSSGSDTEDIVREKYESPKTIWDAEKIHQIMNK